MSALTDLRGRIAAKSAEVTTIISKPTDQWSDEEAATVKAATEEITDLTKQAEELAARDEQAASIKASMPRSTGRMVRGEETTTSGDGATTVKSLNQLMDEADFGGTGARTYKFEIPRATTKALLTLADINNEPTRLPGITTSAQDETTVADLLLQRTTDANSLTYMEETTFTNAAAAVAEGAAKPESALDFTKRTVPIEKIATWLPVTDELLEDVAGLREYVSGRLMFMVRRREEGQILSGDGVSPNLRGLLNATGIQTQAKGTDTVLTALYKGITLVRVTGLAEPTAIVMHPNDFSELVTTRDDSGAAAGTGAYFWGGPINGPQERVWGLPVRVTPLMTENTALIVSRPHAEVVRRTGITVTASSEHSTYFVENKVAILAEERLGLAIYRGSAFATVTGI